MKKELSIRLGSYEAVPPAHVWDEIEAALDDQASPHAALLYNFEQTPPSGAWDKIEEAIVARDEKVIKLSTKKPFIRFAAAAAVILILASAITFFITREKAGGDMAQVPQQIETEKADTFISDKTGEPYYSPDNTTTSSNAKNNSNRDVVKKDKTTLSRYMTIADEEGKKIRLSKKVASVFNCAEDIASANSIRCKENIESLQQKMSASLLSPSGDFSGLMDMIRSLEENN